MWINVAQLLKSPIGTERSYDVDEVIDFDDGEIAVEGEAVLICTDRSILVKGKFNARVEANCSRCLVQFTEPLNIEFEEEFFPTVDIKSGAPVPVPGDSGSFTIDERHIIDLSEAVRQYALMTIPMKPLCRADCAGLCPTCGQNLNTGSCRCPSPETDPRWAKLKGLLSEQ